MSFLWRKSRSGFFMDTVFSALQNGVRRGDTVCVLAMLGELDEFAGATRTRLFACAFDVPSPQVLFGLCRFKGTESELPAMRRMFLVLCEAQKSHDAAWLDRLLIEALLAADGQSADASIWVRVQWDWPALAAIVAKYLPRYRQLLQKDAASAFAGWDPRWLDVSRCSADNPLAFCCAVLSKARPEAYTQQPVLEPAPEPLIPARFTLPAYAYDKHTREGRKLGRDFAHFVREGLQFNHRLQNVDYFQAAATFVLTEGMRAYGSEEKASARALRERYVPPAAAAPPATPTASLTTWLKRADPLTPTTLAAAEGEEPSVPVKVARLSDA